jgi:hypothetical protein
MNYKCFTAPHVSLDLGGTSVESGGCSLKAKEIPPSSQEKNLKLLKKGSERGARI